MKNITRIILSGLGLLSFPMLAQDSASCMCSKNQIDPTPAGMMISHLHRKNEWMFSYRYMHTDMEGLNSGKQYISQATVLNSYMMAPHKMRMDMHMLMAMYGLSNRITLMGMLNYNIHSMSESMSQSTHHHHGMEGETGMQMKTSGIGDLKLNVLLNIFNKRYHQLLFFGGVSIPTGSVQIKDKPENIYAGRNLPYAMQLGSGSYEVLPGINYLFEFGSLSWSSQISSVLRTNYNVLGYKLGNEITFNNWISYSWTTHLSSSLRIEANAMEKMKGTDSDLYSIYGEALEPAADSRNYGGQKMSTFIGSNLFLKPFKIGLELGIPIYQNLNGIQMRTKYSINGSLSLTF